MSNGKGSKRNHPKQHEAAANPGHRTGNPEPSSLNITPLIDKIKDLVNAYEASHKNDGQQTAKNLFWGRFTALSTLAAFVAAAIYACIAAQQRDVMQRQLSSSIRPWVSVKQTLPLKKFSYRPGPTEPFCVVHRRTCFQQRRNSRESVWIEAAVINLGSENPSAEAGG